jgi:hypothetical protein
MIVKSIATFYELIKLSSVKNSNFAQSSALIALSVK